MVSDDKHEARKERAGMKLRTGELMETGGLQMFSFWFQEFTSIKH
jgi:hypothetical protein